MTDNEKRARAKRKREEQRDREMARERLELLKNKAGIAENTAAEQTPEPKKHYTIWQKIESFVYLHKVYIIIFGTAAIIAGMLIYNLLTLVKPDVQIAVITRDESFYALTENIEAVFTPYCEDYNGDGKVSVSVLYFSGPYEPEEGGYINQASLAENTKLGNTLGRDETILLITDYEMIAELDIGDGVLANGKELFSGDKNAVDLGYSLSDIDFLEQIGYTEPGGNFIAAFRKPIDGLGDIDTFRENFDNTLIMWDKFLADNKQS
jgi:hypothetical protein